MAEQGTLPYLTRLARQEVAATRYRRNLVNRVNAALEASTRSNEQVALLALVRYLARKIEGRVS